VCIQFLCGPCVVLVNLKDRARQKIKTEEKGRLYEEGGLFVGCIARIKSCPFGMVGFLFAADVVVFFCDMFGLSCFDSGRLFLPLRRRSPVGFALERLPPEIKVGFYHKTSKHICLYCTVCQCYPCWVKFNAKYKTCKGEFGCCPHLDGRDFEQVCLEAAG